MKAFPLKLKDFIFSHFSILFCFCFFFSLIWLISAAAAFARHFLWRPFIIHLLPAVMCFSPITLFFPLVTSNLTPSSLYRIYFSCCCEKKRKTSWIIIPKKNTNVSVWSGCVSCLNFLKRVSFMSEYGEMYAPKTNTKNSAFNLHRASALSLNKVT